MGTPRPRAMNQESTNDLRAFAAHALLERLDALQRELPGVRQADDPEPIHRARVASRRLRSALSLFSDVLPHKKFTRWQKHVRRLTRALGDARDTDVQIELLDGTLQELAKTPPPERRLHMPGIARLRLRRQQRRERLQRAVERALADWHESEVALAMAETLASWREDGTEVPAYLHGQGKAMLLTLLDDLLVLEPCVQNPEDIEALHAMRIAGKRLRYALEVFEPAYGEALKPTLQALRAVQEALGDIHDCDVWAQFLPRFAVKERERTRAFCGHTRPFTPIAAGLTWLQEERARHRTRRYHAFVALWQNAAPPEVWAALRTAID